MEDGVAVRINAWAFLFVAHLYEPADELDVGVTLDGNGKAWICRAGCICQRLVVDGERVLAMMMVFWESDPFRDRFYVAHVEGMR